MTNQLSELENELTESPSGRKRNRLVDEIGWIKAVMPVVLAAIEGSRQALWELRQIAGLGVDQ